MTALRWLLSAILAGTLGFAGVLKLADPATFSRDLENYRLLDPPLTAAVAVYLPWLEVLTAVCLIVPRWRGGAVRIALLLSTLFLFALASAWLRNLDVDCGCFGAALKSNVPTAIVRALALNALAIWLIWRERFDGRIRSQIRP